MLFFLLGFYIGGMIATCGMVLGTVAHAAHYGISRPRTMLLAFIAGLSWPVQIWRAQENIALSIRHTTALARRDMAREVLESLDKDDAPPPPP